MRPTIPCHSSLFVNSFLFSVHTCWCSGIAPDYAQYLFLVVIGGHMGFRNWTWVNQVQCKYPTCSTITLALISSFTRLERSSRIHCLSLFWEQRLINKKLDFTVIFEFSFRNGQNFSVILRISKLLVFHGKIKSKQLKVSAHQMP